MTRSPLLILAAVGALVAVSTTAEARGGSGGSPHSAGNVLSFNRSSSNSVKVSTPIAIQQKTTVTRLWNDDSHHKRPYKYRWIEPISPVVLVPTPVVVEPIRATSAGGAAATVRVVEPDKIPVVAKATEATTETAAPGATGACLTKEYLDTGAVKFRDTCTKEWAINATDVTKKVTPAAATCLTKDTDQNGVVMFRDTCTREWAMNTPDQMAQDPQAR